MKVREYCVVLVVLLAVGCDRKEAPKQPLSEAAQLPQVDPAAPLPPGHPAIGAADAAPRDEVHAAITGDARIALDSGNALYRAKSYSAALAQYRRAATLVPRNEAPLIGMMMVATVTKNAALADSVTTRLRAFDANATALEDVHAGVKKPQPPVPTTKKL